MPYDLCPCILSFCLSYHYPLMVPFFLLDRSTFCQPIGGETKPEQTSSTYPLPSPLLSSYKNEFLLQILHRNKKKAWLPFRKTSRNRKSPVSRKKSNKKLKEKRALQNRQNVWTSQRRYHRWKLCFMGWTSSRFSLWLRRRSLYPRQGRFLKHRSLECTLNLPAISVPPILSHGLYDL